MRKAILIVLLLLIPASSLFAQEWRDRKYVSPIDTRFDITPYGGYRWGGTIYADTTNLYHHDVDIQSSANYGISFGIPISSSGMKIELLVDRQDSKVGESELFPSNAKQGDFSVTYYQAGMRFPFAVSHSASPYFAFGLGIANLDPKVQGVSSSQEFSMSGAFGVHVPVNQNVGFRFELRGFWTPIDNGHNDYHGCYDCYYDYYYHNLSQGEATVGLQIKF